MEDLSIEARDDPNLDVKKCQFCGRAFSCYTAMRRHVRESCRIAPNAKNGDAGMERLYEHTLQKQLADQKTQIDQQSAEISEMKEMMKQLLQQGAPSSTTLQAGEVAIQAGGDAQVDNSKKIINVNVFGQEKLDHVTAERIKAILDECLQRPALPHAVDEASLGS
jgi:hypothetical protein